MLAGLCSDAGYFDGGTLWVLACQRRWRQGMAQRLRWAASVGRSLSPSGVHCRVRSLPVGRSEGADTHQRSRKPPQQVFGVAFACHSGAGRLRLNGRWRLRRLRCQPRIAGPRRAVLSCRDGAAGLKIRSVSARNTLEGVSHKPRPARQ